MLSWKRTLANAGLEAAYFSGLAHLGERRAQGSGVILKFEHVRPHTEIRFSRYVTTKSRPNSLIAPSRHRGIEALEV